MKIVIFLCDRYDAHRGRGAEGECGFDRLGGPFTVSLRGRGAFYGDSEVLVEEHDEGIVRSNGIVGMLGCTRGVCIELVGCVGERLFRRRLGYTGNVSRSGVWGK